MKTLIKTFTFFVCVTLSNFTQAVTTVTLSDVHLCCVTCQEAVENAVGGVKGSNIQVNRDNKKVTVSAINDKVAQQAVDAVAIAGFYGTSDSDKIAMNTTTSNDTFSSLRLNGVHNCCGTCVSSLESGINAVTGVKETITRKRSCLVKGKFNALDVLKATNKAGFSTKVSIN